MKKSCLMIVCLAFLLAFSAGCKSSTGTKHTEEIKSLGLLYRQAAGSLS
ncbi:hypothetical protein AAG663_04870 [Bacillus licheniformis]